MLSCPNSGDEKSPRLAKEARQISVIVAGCRTLRIPVASCADLQELQRRLQEELGDKGSFEIADVVGMPLQSGASLRDAVSAGRTPLNAMPSGTTSARQTNATTPRGNTPETTGEIVALAGRMSLLEGRLESQRKTVDTAIERLTRDLLAAVEAARDRGKKEAGQLEERIDDMEERIEKVENRDCEELRGCMKNRPTEAKAIDENAQKRFSSLEERCSSLESHVADMRRIQTDTQDRLLQRYENQAAGLDQLRGENSIQSQNLLSLESCLRELEAACGSVINEKRRGSAQVRQMISSSTRSCSPPRRPQAYRVMNEDVDTFNELKVHGTAACVPSTSSNTPNHNRDSTPSFTGPHHGSSIATTVAEEEELRGPDSQSRVSLPQDQLTRVSQTLSPRTTGAALISGGYLRLQGLASAAASARAAFSPREHRSVGTSAFSPREHLMSENPSSPGAIVYQGSVTDRLARTLGQASLQSLYSSIHSVGSLTQRHPGATLGMGSSSAGSGSESRAHSERSRVRAVCVQLGRTGRAQYVLDESSANTLNANRKTVFRHHT